MSDEAALQLILTPGLSTRDEASDLSGRGNIVQKAAADNAQIIFGTVMTPDGKVLSGMRVNEKGEVVAPDGKIYNARELVVDASGTVRTKDGAVLAGVNAGTTGSVLAQAADDGDTGSVDLIIGGASEDGVAKITDLPITK